MPAMPEVDFKWKKNFAWLPTRSVWSGRLIWLKHYWLGESYIGAMGRPPIKDRSFKLLYTEDEYILMLLRSSD